ncbi:MAG: tetratricopeptide repeat protein, partial [Actinobacteria bacterium]|nr:tetratricopeptide repeat protein [Actinomycetota bacterium]
MTTGRLRVGSGKSAVCAKVINSVTERRRFFHDARGGEVEDRRFWADLSGRRRGAEVEEAIATAVGADSLTDALDVLRDRAPTLLVLNDGDEAFAWTAGDDPLLRRLAAGGGGLRLVVTVRGEPRSPGLAWSMTFGTTVLPEESARDLMTQLAPALADHPAAHQLLVHCDGLPLALSIVGRVAATANSVDNVVALTARALQGFGDAPGGKRLQFARALAEASLDAEERDAWLGLSQFPAGLSRDDLCPVLGMALAEHHVKHLSNLGLVARAGAGLRVPMPLRLSAPASDTEPLLWQRFVERGLDVVRSDERAGSWLGRHALNLVALAELSQLPPASLELACEGLEVERDIRRSDLAENALVRLVTATLINQADAARVTSATNVLRERYRFGAAATLLERTLAIHRAAGDRAATATTLLSAGEVAYQRGRYDDAEALFAEAQGIYDEIGDRLGGANARESRGDVACLRGRYDDAEALFAEAQGIYDEIGNRLGGANARKSRGDVAYQRDRYDDAEALFAEAQGIYD